MRLQLIKQLKKKIRRKQVNYLNSFEKPTNNQRVNKGRKKTNIGGSTLFKNLQMTKKQTQ